LLRVPRPIGEGTIPPSPGAAGAAPSS